MRIAKNQMIQTEKKIVARQFAKNFLQTFKRDTLLTMVDLGALRRPQSLSIGTIFLPQLYNQIQTDMQAYYDNQEQLDVILNDSMRVTSLTHKQSIVKELNKRQEKKKEEMRKKREEEEETRKRKEKRQAARERHRLGLLKDQILKEIIGTAEQQEFS